MIQDYIIRPQKCIQQDLFSNKDSEYYSSNFPLFTESFIKWQFNENLFFIVSKDFSYLLISGFGIKLSKKSERLQIKENHSVLFEIPFFRLNTIAIFSKGIGISSDLVEEFSKNKISLSFHEYSGKPYAILQSIFATNSTHLKKLQIEIKNSIIENNLCTKIIYGKVSNQIAVLKYASKNLHPTNDKNTFKINNITNTCIKLKELSSEILNLLNKKSAIKELLLGYEGTSARIYWQAISILLMDKINFLGRQQQFPTDAVNALLNYGYGILYSQVWNAITIVGLDPYISLLHSDEQGKPALVFDLIEEFRAPIVDKTVISFIMSNRSIKIENGLLSLKTRENFSKKIIERLYSKEQYCGKKYQLKDIILLQARQVAECLSNENKIYKNFSFKW